MGYRSYATDANVKADLLGMHAQLGPTQGNGDGHGHTTYIWSHLATAAPRNRRTKADP